MLRYIFQRFISLIILLFLISILVFTVMHLIPGNPVEVFYGTAEGISEDTRIALAHNLGLDQPLPMQYLEWLSRFFQGDWGISYSENQPVFNLVIDRLPSTFLLAISSILFAIIVCVPLAILAGTWHHSPFDSVIMVAASLSQSIPGFWLGIMLMLVFSLKLRWLPTFGFVSPSGNLFEALRHLTLPSITLGLGMAIILMRILRSSLLGELNKEYILVAKSKGLARHAIFWKHALKNSLIPMVGMTGVLFGFAMSGSIVVETIFTWPGVGRLLLDSILNRDYPVVQSIVLINASIIVLANLAVDVLCPLLDPRIITTSKY